MIVNQSHALGAASQPDLKEVSARMSNIDMVPDIHGYISV